MDLKKAQVHQELILDEALVRVYVLNPQPAAACSARTPRVQQQRVRKRMRSCPSDVCSVTDSIAELFSGWQHSSSHP